jgi:hypothetical protein
MTALYNYLSRKSHKEIKQIGSDCHRLQITIDGNQSSNKMNFSLHVKCLLLSSVWAG